MKKILIILISLVFCQTALFAQKTIHENQVPEKYVANFNSLVKNDKVSPAWTQVDSLVYDATYKNESGTKISYRFSPRGTETRWYIDSKYYPESIRDTVSRHYPGFKITELYALSVRNKVTYQTRISKTSGFLFWKREKSVKLLNFETDGKFIDEIALK
ncbi:MAG: hypothetical protein SPJ13_08520 [Bacteroidales bacterium]|nr:hypothetical protein [Bacteroidales bacterium]